MFDWIKNLFAAPSRPQSTSSAAEPKSSVDSLRMRYHALYRPAVHLRPGQSASTFSRLGGLPMMPSEFEWPAWKDKPLAFLAQIDLAEIAATLPSLLPSSGYLFFFYDQDQSVWGFDPKDVDGWRVLCTKDDPSTFVEHRAPDGLAPEFVYPEKNILPHRIDLLPDSQSLPRSEFEWDRDGDPYVELRAEAFEKLHHHQMLGYPSPVQNDNMEEECQLASNGVYVGTPDGYKDPRVATLKAGSADWKLLLQLDSDDDLGWMWGDVGTLYFWVREQDARRGDFSKVWMVFQCC